MPVISVRDLTKTYGEGAATVHALDGVSLDIHHGDYVAIMGTSGSGKSTLMNMIGCLDVPTSGSYLLDGMAVDELTEAQQAVIRNEKIGFVFQSFNLLRRTTAVRNVELPLVYAKVPRKQRHRRAIEALTAVGLADRLDHEPSMLSGGQQQRVAIARAIVTNPAIVLADEPTGALDSHSTADVLRMFDDLNVQGRTVIVITHEDEVARHAKRVIRLVDGKVESDERAADIDAAPPMAHLVGAS